ncbi:unnamed protein product [Cunninghamella echinulata]
MSTTAVRVALRVRPLTQKEQFSNCTECITFIEQQPQILIGKDHTFTYDYVFDPQAPQQNIYETAVTPLVEKYVDGFNATILAYGQTGSGKTFSMGTALDGNIHTEQKGIVPRFIADLFEKLNTKHQGSEEGYQVYVSFLELYNEELIDLLNMQDNRRRNNAGGGNGNCDISIREDIQGNIYWSGVREEKCLNPDDLLTLLARGSLCRTTGSTDMNAVSSRSHAIFSVILKQQIIEDVIDNNNNNNDDDDQKVPTNSNNSNKRTIVSKFHFVDLAGSERLKRTNAQGDRAREGIAINSGLLALGNVISALGDESRKSAHVPYRDSKLTRLLQDSLGGNSQTLMMACVSPSDSNFPETLSTLKYANRARNIKNKVSINQEFAGSSVEVNQLRSQIARLKMELNILKSSAPGSSSMTPGAVSANDMAATRALREEINRLRDRIQHVSDELRETATERDALLVERDLSQWSSNDWPKLFEQLEHLNQPSSTSPNLPPSPISLENNDNNSNSNYENKQTNGAIQLISKYQRTIQQLRDELADTQDRLAFFESTQTPMMQALAMASSLTPSASLFSSNNNNTNHQQFIPQKQSSYKNKRNGGGASKRRIVRHSGSASNRHRRSKVPFQAGRRSPLNASKFRSSRQQQKNQQHDQQQDDSLFLRPQQPTTLQDDHDDHDEIEQWLKETVGPFNNNSTSDLRTEVRDSIEKAKSEIEKGLKVLENIKTRDEAPQFDCDILNDDELFERLQSDESNIILGDLDQELNEGMWNDLASGSQLTNSSNEDDFNSPNHRRSRMSSVETTMTSESSINENEMDSLTQSNPHLARMVEQIQADIHVKEELVTQLEKSENEYIQLRKQFESKLYKLREEILTLKKQRDESQAIIQQQVLQQRRSSYGMIQNANTNSQRENQQLHEVRHAYEIKMKNLLAQLSDLRRKYSHTSSAIQSSRNQNESMLRALRVNVESLKVEKKRMVKRMKEDAERVKEQMIAHEREIQQLRRKQTRHMENKYRLERESKQLQRQLEKKTNESKVTNERLKQLVHILKKAVCEGGILDEKLISKCSSFINLGHLTILSTSSTTHQQRRGNTNSKKKVNKIPIEIRVSKKKHLLDQALLQFIQGKQAILEMKQLMAKRDILTREKSDILSEREDLLQSNDEATETLDNAVRQCMDERLETIEAEISYINARIYGLQNDAAHGLLHDEEEEVVEVVEEDDEEEIMASMEVQSVTSSVANRIEKRVTFADEVMGYGKSTTTNNHHHHQQPPNKSSLPSSSLRPSSALDQSNSEWQDIDALEEKYSLPPGSDPDAAHGMAMKLLHSFTNEESQKIMESLIDDIVALQMNEYHRQATVRQLEKTVQDLRCTLFVMKKAAISTTIENEKKIRKLEHSKRRLSVSSFGEASSTSSSIILPPRRISITDTMNNHVNNDDEDSAIDLRVEEQYQHTGTIFDKIYNDGIRGAIMSPTWNEYHNRDGSNNSNNNSHVDMMDNNSNPELTMISPILKPTTANTNTTTTTTPSAPSSLNDAPIHLNPNTTAGPMRPSVSPLVRRRDSMSSPEQFLQQMLQNNMTKDINTNNNHPRLPLEFTKYHTDRESSTSSINSRHLRRSSLQSDTLSWSSHGSMQHHPHHLPPSQPTSQSTLQQQQQQQYQHQPLQQPQPLPTSFANRRRAHSLQMNQPPTKTGRRRSLLRELTLGGNIREMNECSQPSPLQQQFQFSTTPDEDMNQHPSYNNNNAAAMKSLNYQQQRPASAFAIAPKNKYHHSSHPSLDILTRQQQQQRSETPNGGSIFDRLASTHTTASQAKRSPSSLGYRYSSGSFEDIQRRWEIEQSV